jgi:RND family efflux transporter MFP subunit
MLAGCGKSAKPEAEKTPPAPVKWETPRQVNLEEWTELVGTTSPLPDHAARLTAPVGGVVLSVLPPRSLNDDVAHCASSIGGCALSLSMNGGTPIVEGQMIRKGDVLVQLDATLIQVGLAKAQALKKVTQAEREVAMSGVKQAAIELKRLEELAREPISRSDLKLVSPIMLEKAALALEAAQALVRADDRKLEAAEKEEVALETQMRLYTLAAPRKGTLGRIQVVMGQTLPVGAPVAEVVDIEEEIDVLCFVAPSEVRKLQVGQPAHYGSLGKTDGETGPSPEGKVVYIADQAEPDSGLFAVKVRLPNTDLKLRASTVARVKILTKPGKVCWAVPEAAVLEDDVQPRIVIVENIEEKTNHDGKEEKVGAARRLRVTLGIHDREKKLIEIVSIGDKWQGELENVEVIFDKGRSLETGDVVKFEEEEEEEEEMAKPAEEKK